MQGAFGVFALGATCGSLACNYYDSKQNQKTLICPNQEPGSHSYKITHSVGNQGFFSAFNTVLGALDYYDRNPGCAGLEINFGDTGLFYEQEHGSNWWEYYFEPIRLGKGNLETTEFKPYQKIIFSLTAQFELTPERGNELIQKYIIIKSPLREKINNFVEQNFKGFKVIGIHYRGTDKKDEAPTVTYDYVKNMVSNEAQDQHVKFFIATDDTNFLTYMKRNFPERIVAIDAIRSNDDKAVHWPRSDNMHKKGQDAVMDCVLLSRCCKLYKMASNLSDVSLRFNPSLPVIYLNDDGNNDLQCEKYSPVSSLNVVLSLLQDYEKGILKDTTINFPIKKSLSDETVYGDTQGTNWWNYHFMPLYFGKGIPIMLLPAYKRTILHLNALFTMPSQQAHKLLNQYIHLKPHIVTNIDHFASQNFTNHNVIGIHYIKQEGIIQDLLQPSIPYETILNHIEKAQLNHLNNALLFVHTNDQQFLNLLQKKFKNVCYYHVPIKSDDKSISQKEKEEITLINCSLLSKSNLIIGTSTELLRMVAQFNPTVPIQKLDVLWLEKE